MIWILGGTSESVTLIERIQGKLDYIVTVATASGQACLPETARVRVGRMNPGQMREFIQEQSITLVVDLTHPYATEVTGQVQRICQELRIRYVRYVRESSEARAAIRCASLEECAAFLQGLSHTCVFFTTGSKHIEKFQQIRGKNRFVYRVLPAPESLKICVAHQVEMKDIVAALGPFSEAMNIAMFREYRADYVVMKDSGQTGGTPQKISACETLGISPVLLLRKEEQGFTKLEQLEETLFAILHSTEH
ncbi:precorrin-6A reductase [candidate division KSB3 bacterium]|uniref:Precorrin-6A reductase n=1 Tax=candidate division KSB3 bacterium TaxID=2044937 RepID=A0A2G6E9U3_9BACT|nr:MAG: precorrin-6A reductase [candidate division KSB3 bacterium]PIE30910.1 MAG: precorrin-6A reductase [candidate division KSB3 bacterium]